MPNPEISHDGRGRSPSAQRNRRHERRSKAPGSAGASVNAARRERHRDGKRRSSASRRKRRKHGREREARRSPEKLDGFGTDGDVHGLAVEYDDVSSQSERFSASPSPRAEPTWAELTELRDGDVTPGKKSRRDPPDSSSGSRQDRDLKIKDQKSRDDALSSKPRERTRNHDSNGKKSSADNKREAKRHKSRTKPDKEPPSAYRDTPQAYRDERDELRAYRRSPAGFNKAESPYSSSSYPYGYQSPNYNPFPSYGSKRLSPTSTSSYYGRDAEPYSGYSASKSPSSKRKRSPGSPYAWRRSPSPYEAWESTSSPYSRKRSRSPYRKSVSPSPEQR